MSEEQPLAEQTSSFELHVWQPQTQRRDGFSDRDAGCQGWKMVRCQWCHFPMQRLSCLLTGAFDPDTLAPFLSLLRPHAFSIWNGVHVLAVGLPWTRCAHFDIVTLWCILSFQSEFVTSTVLAPSSIFHLRVPGCQEGRRSAFIGAKKTWKLSAHFSLLMFVYPACFASPSAKCCKKTVCRRRNKWDKSPSCHLPK